MSGYSYRIRSGSRTHQEECIGAECVEKDAHVEYLAPIEEGSHDSDDNSEQTEETMPK